jgi:hypothetical protein
MLEMTHLYRHILALISSSRFGAGGSLEGSLSLVRLEIMGKPMFLTKSFTAVNSCGSASRWMHSDPFRQRFLLF